MAPSSENVFDVAVIGAGVAGCAVARQLARYDVSACVLEADNDIACGATRANSGIVHAGYDPLPGTLKARYNREGAALYPQWAAELGFPYQRNGSMVVAFTEDGRRTLEELLERGRANGIGGLSLVSGEEARALEPNLSPACTAALVVEGGAICDPYLVTLRCGEWAARRGVEFRFNQRVETIEKLSIEDGRNLRGPSNSMAHYQNGGEGASEGSPGVVGENTAAAVRDDGSEAADPRFRLITDGGEVLEARCVVNAAGVFSDEMHNQVSAHKIAITPRRGDYDLLSTDFGPTFQRTMFQAPTAAGKGVLVTPTVHGNLILGPTAIEQQSKTDLSTSVDGLATVAQKARETWPGLTLSGLIANFAGLRASNANGYDFVIGQPADAPGFFDIACLDSPGLTCAPAIAVDVCAQIAERLGAALRTGEREAQPGEELLSGNATEVARCDNGTGALGGGAALAACGDRDGGCELRARGQSVPWTSAIPFANMTQAQREEAVARNPRYGRVICRCCTVTEAEIVAALHGPLPVLSLDALKWRTRAMMGGCHGGFCTPEIVEIVGRELGVSPDQLDKRLSGSPVTEGAPEGYGARAASELERVLAVGEQPRASDVRTGKSEPAQLEYDVVVVGGGAAGLAAARMAADEGARVALVDRESAQGGILRQCVHNGFGLHRFAEELTGPEYAAREIAALSEGAEVDVFPVATALAVEPGPMKRVSIASPAGALTLCAPAVVLATGSKERSQGALNLAGSRPSGVFSAGTAQNFMNLQGCLPGKRVVVLGSGDIGLIMARRMALQGAEVLGVYELMDTPSGLRRNIVQCLDDFGIPLHLSRTVTRLEGQGRLEAVWVSRVDPATRKPIPGTEQRVECDTLLLSVGLLPENKLVKAAGAQLSPITGGAVVDQRMETSLPGVFACGNALHIHDLVDFASAEGEVAGREAARTAFAMKASGTLLGSSPLPDIAGKPRGAELVPSPNAAGLLGLSAELVSSGASHSSGASFVPVQPGDGVRYVVPQKLGDAAFDQKDPVKVSLRVSGSFRNGRIVVEALMPGEEVVLLRKKPFMVAVPAEMVQLEVPMAEAWGCNQIRVRVEEA